MKFKDKVEQFWDKAENHAGYFMVAVFTFCALLAMFVLSVVLVFQILGVGLGFTILLTTPIILCLVLILTQKEE